MSKKEKIRQGHRLVVRNIKDTVDITLSEHTQNDRCIKLNQLKRTLEDKLKKLNELDEEILEKIEEESEIFTEIAEAGKFTELIH